MYLLVNIPDMASPELILPLRLLFNGLNKLGYILGKKRIDDHWLILAAENKERAEALTHVLKKKRIRSKVRQREPKNIIPLEEQEIVTAEVPEIVLEDEQKVSILIDDFY